MARTILHVDMDAFYTSVEQRDHPEYRGRPVVVGADPRGGEGRGVVAAASYEARSFGIHSAQPIRRAWKLCPEAVYLRGDMEKYGRISKRIMAILGDFTDLVEPLSIDEAFLDVTGSGRLHGGGREIALAVKRRILEEEKLGASIGIAPNKFLAKVASDLEKPGGLVEVPVGQEAAFLADLPVERLWGVGPRTADTLHRLGLYKIRDVTRLTEQELSEHFGKHGVELYRLSRGIDDRPVVPTHEPKSMGHETTFARDIDDPVQIRQTLLELSESVARRLRKHQLRGRTVTLKFRDDRFVTETRALTLKDPTHGAREIFEAVLVLLSRVATRGRKVRLLGVSMGKLSAEGESPRQLRLFSSEGRDASLNETMDRLIERYGASSVRRASIVTPGRPRRRERKGSS